MKVFISWSGAWSMQVAAALRDWLKVVVNEADPFMSDADIGAGERGLAEIEKSLTDAEFGIIVVTHENQGTPWINFEAGAISKRVDDAQNRVVPLMVDMKKATELSGPLSQFQAKPLTKDGIYQVVKALALVAGASVETVDTRFEACWPILEGNLAKVAPPEAEDPAEPERDTHELVEEVLTHVRALRAEAGRVGPEAPFSYMVDPSEPVANWAAMAPHMLGQIAADVGRRFGATLTPVLRADSAGLPKLFLVPADAMPSHARMAKMSHEILLRTGLMGHQLTWTPRDDLLSGLAGGEEAIGLSNDDAPPTA